MKKRLAILKINRQIGGFKTQNKMRDRENRALLERIKKLESNERWLSFSVGIQGITILLLTLNLIFRFA